MTAKDPAQRAMTLLKTRGLVRSRDLEAAGMSRTQLRRLRERGRIDRVARGLYALPGAAFGERHHLVQAAHRVPGGVLCLLSALRYHGLTTQNPFEVWLAIDRKAWRPRPGHPPMRLVYMSRPRLHADVEQHRAEGVTLRVFTAARTVADCFKFRNKIGTDVAVEALRDYRRRHPRQLEAVWRCAEAARVTRVMRPYLEALG